MSETIRRIKKKISQGMFPGAQQPPSEPEPPLPQHQPLQPSQSQNQTQCQINFGHIIDPAELEKEINGQKHSTAPLVPNPPAGATPNNGVTPLRPPPKQQCKSPITPAPGQQGQTDFVPGHSSHVSMDLFGTNNRK